MNGQNLQGTVHIAKQRCQRRVIENLLVQDKFAPGTLKDVCSVCHRYPLHEMHKINALDYLRLSGWHFLALQPKGKSPRPAYHIPVAVGIKL